MFGSVLYPSLLSGILALVALSFAHQLHKMVRSFAVFSVASAQAVWSICPNSQLLARLPNEQMARGKSFSQRWFPCT